jgi:GTPase SAR1 family protein
MLFKEGDEVELTDEGELKIQEDTGILLFMILRPNTVNEVSEQIASHYKVQEYKREQHVLQAGECRSWAMLKIMLVGGAGAGKWSLFTRMAEDRFVAPQTYLAVTDFKLKTFVRDSAVDSCTTDLHALDRSSANLAASTPIKVQLWFIPNPRRYQSEGHERVYRGASAIVMVFDITNRESYTDLERYKTRIARYCWNGIDPQVPVVLVGAKADLVEESAEDMEGHHESYEGGGGVGDHISPPAVGRAVSVEEATAKAAEWGALYVETSAKTGAGVNAALCAAVEAALQHKINEQRMGITGHPPRQHVPLLEHRPSPVCQCSLM